MNTFDFRKGYDEQVSTYFQTRSVVMTRQKDIKVLPLLGQIPAYHQGHKITLPTFSFLLLISLLGIVRAHSCCHSAPWTVADG